MDWKPFWGRDAKSARESNDVCQMNRSAMKSANVQEETTFHRLFGVVGIQRRGAMPHSFLNELSGPDVCVLNERWSQVSLDICVSACD